MLAFALQAERIALGLFINAILCRISEPRYTRLLREGPSYALARWKCLRLRSVKRNSEGYLTGLLSDDAGRGPCVTWTLPLLA